MLLLYRIIAALLCFLTASSVTIGNAASSQQDCNSIIIQERCADVTENCETCLNHHPCCSWCFQHEFDGFRCQPKQQLLNANCSSDSIYEVHSSLEIEKDVNFSNLDDEDESIEEDEKKDEEIVQIRPQKIKIKLRYREPITFQLKYKAIENYPLDLYFLLDFTYTLRNYLDNISKLGKDLGKFLANLTKTYKIGLGFYADKAAVPYAYLDGEYLENPCYGSDEVCEKLFDFKHKLDFTNNIEEFIKEVTVNKTTKNVDDLEGGFDALMQVLSCDEEMLWRKLSRKIVLFTIAGYPMHTAGEGILGGAVKKNPGVCSLDSSGEYSKSLEYDYPSVEEIYRKLLKKKINVLFLILDQTEYYDKIHLLMPELTHVRKFDPKNSQSVLEDIKEGYLNVVKNVRFIPSFKGSGSLLNISAESSCNKEELQYKWNETFSCDNVILGQEYVFNFTLQLTRPPSEYDKEEILTIQEQNIHEKLLVEIEYVGNECKCKDKLTSSSSSDNQTLCLNGKYKCGKCECDLGWGGRRCDVECEENVCREFPANRSLPCTGRGTCSREECGCLCNSKYSGKYCQHRQCPISSNGFICGGLKHGKCVEGNCVCEENFTGKDCSCSTSLDTCTIDGKVCNNAGTCVCGKCKCNKINNVQYEGKYCERCPECKGFCEKYSDCILSTIDDKNKNKDKEKPNLCEFNVTVTLNKKLNFDDPKLCTKRFYKDEETCDVYFNYDFEKLIDSVALEYEKKCWKPIAASLIGGFIIAAVLGLGILLLIGYKVKLTIQDKRELAKFNKRREQEQYIDLNPIYNSPIKTYEMPEELRNN